MPKTLRQFTTFDSDEKPQATPQQRADEGGGREHTLFFKATRTLPLPEQRLLLHTLHALTHSQQQFDQDTLLDFALRDALLPDAWRRMGWLFRGIQVAIAKQYIRTVESPTRGVPGIVGYLHARRVWVDQHVKRTCRANGCANRMWQLVSIGCGFETRSLRLLQTDIATSICKAFEVDTPEIIASKKTAIELLCTRYATLSPKLQTDKICHIGIDWNNHSALIPTITSHGFDPMVPSIFVVEGLLPHLRQIHVDALLSDIAALCAPGSHLVFDFLHADAFESLLTPSIVPVPAPLPNSGLKESSTSHKTYSAPGFANLAFACRNKGSPFMSGQPALKSHWNKTLGPLQFRINKFIHGVNMIKYDDGRKDMKEGTMEVSKKNLCRPMFAPVQSSVSRAQHDMGPQYYSLVTATKLESRIRPSSYAIESSWHKDAEPNENRSLMALSEGPSLGCLYLQSLFHPFRWFTGSSSCGASTANHILGHSSRCSSRHINEGDGDTSDDSSLNSNSNSKLLPPNQEESSRPWSLAAVARMTGSDQGENKLDDLDGSGSTASGDEHELNHALSIPLPPSILPRKF